MHKCHWLWDNYNYLEQADVAYENSCCSFVELNLFSHFGLFDKFLFDSLEHPYSLIKAIVQVRTPGEVQNLMILSSRPSDLLDWLLMIILMAKEV